MSNSPAPSTPANDAPQEKSGFTKLFFGTKDKDGHGELALFQDPKNPNWEPGRPAMFGTIEGKKVSVFVEPAGTKNDKAFGAFFTINQTGEKLPDGGYSKDERLGKANLVVTKEGQARLAINVGTGEEARTVWATPRKEATLELMAKGGLDVDKLNQVRAERAAGAANEADKRPAPKVA